AGQAGHGAQARFWAAVDAVAARKYELQAVHAVDKFSQLCRDAIRFGDRAAFAHESNTVYRLALDSLPTDLDSLRGRFGYFYEFTTSDLGPIAPLVNARYQTVT